MRRKTMNEKKKERKKEREKRKEEKNMSLCKSKNKVNSPVL
jgi:hypothetical protein